MTVGDDQPAFVDQEPGSLPAFRIDLKKPVPPVDDARDIDRGVVGHLVDVDIILLIGSKIGRAGPLRLGPQVSGLLKGLEDLAKAPARIRRDVDEPRNQSQSPNDGA